MKVRPTVVKTITTTNPNRISRFLVLIYIPTPTINSAMMIHIITKESAPKVAFTSSLPPAKRSVACAICPTPSNTNGDKAARRESVFWLVIPAHAMRQKFQALFFIDKEVPLFVKEKFIKNQCLVLADLVYI